MNVILHMPHTSQEVPTEFYEGLLISRQEFNRYNLLMSDVGIDTLFKDLDGYRVRPKYSRLFCDVERFRNDKDEVMSKVGQGVVYTHTFDGVEFHKNDAEYKTLVLKYYDEYHKRLDTLAENLLEQDKDLLILDLHSFSDQMASSIQAGPFPDICIGVEEEYYNEDVLNQIKEEIHKKGYI